MRGIVANWLLAQITPDQTASASSWTFNPTISLGDLAQALSLPLTVLIAWLTIRHATKEQRELLEKTAADQRSLALLQEVLSRLSELIQKSNRVSHAVYANLSNPQPDYKDHQRSAELLRKELDIEIEIIKIFVSETQGTRLELGYGKWYDSTFCEGWPGSPQAGAFSPGDTRLRDIADARIAWVKIVMELKRELVEASTKG
jgi:hypothetical protein